MPIPQCKDELLVAITNNYNKLKAELLLVPTNKVFIVEMDGHAKGSKMSVANLVGYLIGWGQLVIKWHKKHQEGEIIDFPETGFKWNELGALAQKFYADYENYKYNELISLLDKTVNEILAIIHKNSNKKLYETAFYKHYPLGRMIQLNTASPYKNATGRLRKWKKSSV